MWNVDFKSIIPDIKLDDLNRLERWWLRQIGFDVTVKRTLYAKYWFGIREMTDRLNGVKLGRTEVQVNLKAKSDMHMNLVGVAPESRDGKYLSPQNKTKSTLVKVPSTAEDHDGDNDTLPSLPKPLTEKHMQKLSASSTYSQTKIRESFQELYDNVQTEEADCANEPRLTVNGGGRRGSQQTSNVSEFGWGSKLRRSKSDHLYEPVIPSASVL